MELLIDAIAPYLRTDFIVVVIGAHQCSLVELIGIVSGLASVFLAARRNIHTWSLGLVNVACLFIVFYQVQLYADMMLQLWFAAASLYGWWSWRFTAAPTGKLANPRVSSIAIILTAGTVAWSALIRELPVALPHFFEAPPALPIVDSFVATASVVATVMLARKQSMAWWLWIAVNLSSIPLYAARGLPFLSGLYAVFLLNSFYGLWCWYRTAPQSVESPARIGVTVRARKGALV